MINQSFSLGVIELKMYMINIKHSLNKNEVARNYRRPRNSLSPSDYLFPCDFDDLEFEE